MTDGDMQDLAYSVFVDASVTVEWQTVKLYFCHQTSLITSKQSWVTEGKAPCDRNRCHNLQKALPRLTYSAAVVLHRVNLFFGLCPPSWCYEYRSVSQVVSPSVIRWKKDKHVISWAPGRASPAYDPWKLMGMNVLCRRVIVYCSVIFANLIENKTFILFLYKQI